MANKPKIHFIRRTKSRFCALRTIADLSKILKVESYKLQFLAINPKYHIFSVPKKNGSKRWIEDPDDKLQGVQNELGFFLSACYFLQKTDAAYGFVLTTKKDTSPRNIVTNARQHLGAKWMYNADLKDFFHQVKTESVFRIFTNPPFEFNTDLADLLANLTTHQGRLPMGAPTSPVLSNFATIEMDKQLLQLAHWAGWKYTRYADDLCFSSQNSFSDADISKIQETVEDAGFAFNEQKFKLLGPTDTKEITGIELGKEDVQIPLDFLDSLKKELEKLRHVIEVANRMGKHERWIDKFRQQVEGKIAFVQYVHGDDDKVSHELDNLLEDALNPPDEFGTVTWLDFGYF